MSKILTATVLASAAAFLIYGVSKDHWQKNEIEAIKETTQPPLSSNSNKTSEFDKQSNLTQEVKKSNALPVKDKNFYGDFNNWLQTFNTSKNKDTLIEAGIEIAKNRAEQLKKDIQKNPRRALNNSLSYSEFSALPIEIKKHVETPITAKADLDILPNESKHFAVKNHSVIQYQENGQRFFLQVSLFGDRKQIRSKEGLAIQGIRLGEFAAISDRPFQLLSKDDANWAINNLPSGQDNLTQDFFTNEVISSTPVIALSQGKVHYFANQENLEALNTAILKLEAMPGPKSHLLGKTANIDTQPPLQTQLSRQVLQASTWTETNKKVYFIRIDFSDKPGESVNEATFEGVLNGAVATEISNYSYGKTTIEGLANSTVDVSSQVVRVPQVSTYYRDKDSSTSTVGSVELYDDAITAFNNLSTGIDLSQFDIVGIHFTDIGFDYAGLASIEGSKHWLHDTTSTNVIVHEFGHNYGLYHANYWDTSGTSVVGAGTEIAYGDIFDTMGGGAADFHIQAKSRLNWIPTSDWTDVSSSNTYRVYRFDQSALNNNNKALRVNKGSNEYYWLGYRQDFTNNPVLQKGAYIIWQRPNAVNSVLIDTTPGSSDGKNDAGISLGRTYSDTDANLHITPVAVGGSGDDAWIDIQVNSGSFAGNQNPSVTIESPATLTARTPLTFTANASDPDNDTLAYSWDFGDGVIHDNTSSIVQSWTVGGNYSISVTVTDMKGGTAAHTINVTVIDPAATWTDRTSTTSNSLVDIATDGSTAIAVSNFAFLSSTDGITWNQIAGRPRTNTYLRAITNNGSKWIAVGEDYDFESSSWKGTVYTSTNGSTWTEKYKNGNPLHDVTANGAIIVAVGENGEAIRSTDNGENWSPVASNISTGLRGVSFGNSTFIATGNQYITGELAAVTTSSDGQIWSNQTSGAGTASARGYSDIEYLNDKFIGSGVNSRLGYLENTGGISFITTRTNRESTPAMMYGNGIYFAAGKDQDNSFSDIDLISTDGKTWTTSSSTTSVPDRNAGIFFKNTFITVGENGSIRQSNVFTTTNDDSDSDGQNDSNEVSVPNSTGSGNGDGNGDGIQDNSQNHVTSILAQNGSNWLSFTNTSNAAQSNFVNSTAPSTLPADNQLIYDATQFDIATTSGATITIEVYVDKDTGIQDYLLLGNDGNWTAQNATVTHTTNKTKLVFNVTEGGNFDRDATANGVLQLAQGGVMVKSGLEAWPFSYLFGNTELNTQTSAKTFTIKNTGSRNLTMSRSTTSGNNPADFVINSDNCNAQTLAPNATCTLTASFQPTSIGSKSAMLTISTDDPDNAKVNIFLRNHESDEEESERRLPPVLSAISIEDATGTAVSTMKSNTQYTIKWTILGYYDDFTSLLTMFNCSGINDGSCGDNYSDSTRFLSAGPLNTDAPASDGIWSNGDVRSKVFTFSHTFTTPNYVSSTPIVIRFYRKSNKDEFIGNGSLSLIIPGNQAEDYYDTTGRRIKNTIAP